MGVFASDTFDVGGIGDLVGRSLTVGGTWTDGSPSGSPISPTVTAGGQIRQQVSPTTHAYASSTAPSADYQVQCDVVPSGGSGAVGGVFGRKTAGTGAGNQTLYIADYHDHATAGSRQWRLYGYNAGALIGGALFGTYTENIGTTSTTLRLSMVGTAIKLYVNGVERVAATDSTISAAGVPGVICGAATSPFTSTVFVDNFSAYTPYFPAQMRRRPSGLYVR